MSNGEQGLDESFDAILVSDKTELEAYRYDWTRQFHGSPRAVLKPNTIDDIKQIIKYCWDHSIKLIPVGGRTNLVGSTIASQNEIIVDMCNLNAISEVDKLSQSVWVQSGVITEVLNEHLNEHSLQWPVDLAAKGSSQIGGNLATNVGGMNVVRYGMVRNWVRQIRVLTMQGEDLVFGKNLEKDNTGYDLKDLFIGSEGTLGIIVEANLKLCPLPEQTETYFIAVPNIESALVLLDCVNSKIKRDIHRIEYISKDSLELVAKVHSLKLPFANASDSVLLETSVSQDNMHSILEPLLTQGQIIDIRAAQSSVETTRFWKFRHEITEALHSQTNKWVAKFDVSIPFTKMSEFLEKVFTPEYAKIFVFGHLGDGNLHLNILFDDKPTDFAKIEKGIYEKLASLGGSISAEHGIGLLKKSWLHLSRSSEEIQYMKQIKKIFDPKNLLNPGKIFD